MSNDENVKIDQTFKLVIVGDTAVGKSMLMLRFAEDMFLDNHISTIAVDFRIRQVHINGKFIKLLMWDTSAQERFQTVTTSYYRGDHGIVAVFDLTNMQTFVNVEKWFQNIEKYSGDDVDKTSIVLVGNKADLRDKRLVTFQQAQDLAEKLGVPYIETSAKIESNVKEAFITLATEIKKSVTT